MLNKLYGMDSCDGCILHQNGFVVPGEGPVPCKIMVLGEAPGENESYVGRPFIGAAGKKLDGFLAIAGLTREDVYLANSVKHHPGEGNPTPSTDIVRACRPWLDLEIEMVDPDTIICLGKTAAVNILGAVDMKKVHGTSVVAEVGGRARTVHVLYHPAAGLHNPGLVPVIEEDFRNLSKGSADYLNDTEVVWIRSWGQLPIIQGSPCISLDLETTSLDTRTTEITAVSWSTSPERGFVASPSTGILRSLAGQVSSIGRVIVHNGSFDIPILARYGVYISPNQVWDTLLSAYILGKDQALKTRALRELNILMETYKQASGGKKNSAEADPWKLFPYAAIDAVVPLMLQAFDEREIKANKAEEGLWIEHHLTPIFNDMHVRGIRFDRDKAKLLEGDITKHVNILRDQIHNLAGHTVDLNYSPAVAGLLFEELKLKPGKKTPSKANWSTDEEVLKGLVGAHPIIPLLLDYRKHSKMVSTYVTSPLVLSEEDGRLHSRFKQAGARGGRTSSEDPNLQNIPQRNGWDKKIKELFLPDEGELLIEWDFSQLEYRVGAALSEDPVLLEIYRNDEDLHDYNTKYILGREPGNPDDRRLAKNVGFGLTFRMGAKGLQGYLATVAEPPIYISMKEAIRLYDTYHERFSHMFMWQDGIIEAAKATGYGENLFHYRRYLPELLSDDPNTVKEAEKIAVNIPYQGTAGVITKKALTKLASYPILNTVHDSILMSVKPQWVKVVGEDVQRIMEKTAEEILGIPVKVEWGSGSTWARCK